MRTESEGDPETRSARLSQRALPANDGHKEDASVAIVLTVMGSQALTRRRIKGNDEVSLSERGCLTSPGS